MTLMPSPEFLPLLKVSALSWLGALTLLGLIAIANYLAQRSALKRIACALGLAAVFGLVFVPQFLGPCCWECWGWFFCRVI